MAAAELRVVTPEHWGIWRELRLEALADAPTAFSSTSAEWESAPEERWRARLEVEGSHNLLAFVEGAAVGMASGVPHHHPDTVELVSMYVSAPARGRGVGDLLVGGVERWAGNRGFRRLCLEVVVDNVAARRLYERHGLVVVGEARPPGKPLELWMCKSLDRPPGPPPVSAPR